MLRREQSADVGYRYVVQFLMMPVLTRDYWYVDTSPIP